MVKRRRRRSKRMRNNNRIWWWVTAAFVALVLILVIDLKPWRKQHAVVNDQWPYYDMTKGTYNKDFDGLDISRHQGKIHWDELVEENQQLRFVYIKATEGSSLVDPFYKRNFKAAKERGLLVGSYHFLTNRTSMERQVDNFLSNIDLNQQDLLLLVDIEKDGTRNWKRDIIQKNLAEFIRLVKERTGHSPMIYTNESYYHLNLYPEFNHYQLFIWTYVDIDQLREGVSVDDFKMPK